MQRQIQMVLIMRMEWNVRHLKKRALTEATNATKLKLAAWDQKTGSLLPPPPPRQLVIWAIM